METATLRILRPAPGLFAYYDGRIAGRRLHSTGPNWVDDGAYDLGTASYALVEGDEALVYDTHVSLAHARAIRTHLEGLGVARFRVVLSHWHADHVAGNAVFADGEIVALRLTAAILAANRAALASDTPPIDPLVMPNRLFETRLDLMVGRRRVELHHFEIHSADGLVLWLPDEGLLLAGDTVEDTVTYVAEAAHTPTHIRELARLKCWPIRSILPNHGDPDRIAAGGYDPRLVDANALYLDRLLALAQSGEAADDLRAFVADEVASGAIGYFAPYARVHRANEAAMRAAFVGPAPA